MSIQPAALFAPRWEVFWGTTYSFELELFDEYLLRRLGDPPLNATVLVDFMTLAKVWGEIPPGEEWRVQRVNRLYLVRSAGRPQGRFHPKTYFFANGTEGSLLVGSGNLSLSGLEEGKEVFCRFDSSDEAGLAAILAWRDWMKDVVDRSGDQLLGQRWFRLLQTAKDWLKGPIGPSSFTTNADVSFLDQLLPEGAEAPELHVTAPFFDKDAHALRDLIERAQPERVSLYLGKSASVDGSALRRLLKSIEAEVSVFAFDPPRFVHAKLIAAIRGKDARVLSGSPNMSRAALTSTLTGELWANTEVGTLTECSAEAARELFTPPEHELNELSLDALADLAFVEPPQPAPLPLRLHSARPDEDGTVEVSYEGQPKSDLFLSSGSARAPVVGSRTTEAFPSGDGSILVWLTGPEGEPLSNRVPIDDVVALRRQLEKPSSQTADRPRELDSSDLQHPVAQVLARLHNEFIFDLDELDSIREAERANQEDAEEIDAGGFWERLAQEELQVDPRAAGYRRFGAAARFEGDDVLLLLRMMLDRTPEERHQRARGEDGEEEEREPGPGRRWTVSQRLQVRMMNVLTRWARALADPRMNWLHPYASVRNFGALLYAVSELWELEALPLAKVKRATDLIFSNFVRSEEADGYLYQLDSDGRKEALSRLEPEARPVATTLAYMGLRPMAGWEENIFEWQAWLKPSLDHNVVVATREAAELASRISGEQVTEKTLGNRLAWARDYIDDDRWCQKMQKLCGLDDVRFSKQRFSVELVLEVEASQHLVDDPGVVRLIRNALDFRRADGIVIMSGPERVVVRIGDQAFARLSDGGELESAEPITATALALLDQSGLPLRERLAAEQAESSAS